MRKISERGLFGVLVIIISMLAVQMSAFASNTYENSTQIKAQLQLDAEDEEVLNQYFQNRAENFYGNTVVDGWMKKDIQEVSYQDKAFSEVNCAEVREYPDGTGQLILTLEKIPAENVETE